jgi:hypothetical protein
MWRALGLLALLLVGSPVTAAQRPVVFTFGGTTGTLILSAAGWLDGDRVWFAANAKGVNDLPYSAAACPDTGSPAAPDCALWGVIDVRQGVLLSLHAQRDLKVSDAALVDGRLLIAGSTTRTDLDQVPGSALPSNGPSGRYLLVAPPMGSAQSGSYLPAEFSVHAVVPIAGDLVIAGSAACNPCAPGTTASQRIRLIRVDGSLTSVRYDRVLPGRWSIREHVVDDSGRIHLAVSGNELPTSVDSAVASLPPPIWSESHNGGLVGVNAADGELAYATYLRVSHIPGIAWDAGRNGVWVLANTLDRNLPLTPDASDSTFCEAGACVDPQCVILTGMSCGYPRDAVLQRVDRDGRRIDHATFVGGPASDLAVALYLGDDARLSVLSIAGYIGSANFGGNDTGPRVFTVVDPEARVARTSSRTPEAVWTFTRYPLALDASRGDLYGNAREATSRPGLPVIHLTPACDAPGPGVRTCFSIMWLEHLGSDPDEAQQIPGPALPALLMLGLLLGLTGVIFRIRALGS